MAQIRQKSDEKVLKKCYVKCIGLLLTGDLGHPFHLRGNLIKHGPQMVLGSNPGLVPDFLGFSRVFLGFSNVFRKLFQDFLQFF